MQSLIREQIVKPRSGNEVAKIQKSFTLDDSSPTIKHEPVRMDFSTRNKNNVYIRLKFVCLQCSWDKKLYDDYFH